MQLQLDLVAYRLISQKKRIHFFVSLHDTVPHLQNKILQNDLGCH